MFVVCESCIAAKEITDNQASVTESRKVKFNTAFITEFNKDIDISWLENGAEITPGTYRVTIFINEKKTKAYTVQFVQHKDNILPCIPTDVFRYVTLNESDLPEKWREARCIDVFSVFKGATAKYDYDSETLRITVPQIYLASEVEGVIDPSRWDEGIDALSLNYSLSGATSAGKYSNYSAYYGNLQTQMRAGAWRFTTLDALSGGSNNKNKLQHLQAYAQRAVAAGLAELSLGDFSTSGSFFETVPLRGVMLKSDERMLPWSIKGYAPQISGIAYSNATITIAQNNNIIYEKNVPPGEFRITDLIAPGLGGDLEVTIRESNGIVKKFKVPYSSLPQLVRKGHINYSLAVGKIRHYASMNVPGLLESGLRYGLLQNLTIYGGSRLTTDKSYFSMNGGVAFNAFPGAISIELTQSSINDEALATKNNLRDNSRVKVGLAKKISETDTFVNVSGYYHLGDSFYSLNDFLAAKETKNYLANRNNSLEVTLSQQLMPGWGEFSLIGLWEKKNYSDGWGGRSSYLLGYRNNYDFVNYSLSVNKTYTAFGNSDTAFFANVSMPLGYTKKSPPVLRAAVSYNNEQAKLTTSVNGSHQGKNYSSGFSSYFSQTSTKQSDFGINVSHTDTVLQKGISFNQRKNGYGFSGAVSGAVLVHAEGVQLAPYLGDTVALLKAHGGEGATVSGNIYSKIKKNGYGLLPNLSPYEENRLSLDTKGSPLGFDTGDDEYIIVPTAGAVIKVEYKSNAQYKNNFLARVKDVNGKVLPFGTRIQDEKGKTLGMVGQAGIVIISLPDKWQPVVAKWKKDNKTKSCYIEPWEGEIEKQRQAENRSITLICKESK